LLGICRHADHVMNYIQSDVPADLTLAQWRRWRAARRARRRRWPRIVWTPARQPVLVA
jgi:hypothetical protein